MRNVQRRIVRQSIAVFVFFCSLFFGSSLVQAAPFPDMPTTGASEITRLHRDGILLGNPDGTLKPHQQVTRAEAVTMIGRALKLDGTRRSTKFHDVPAHHYASGYIASGVEKGWISGKTATSFAPSAPVTRAEMAVFLQRAFQLTATRPDVMYRDVTSQTFGATAINAITTARISAGYPDGSFGPTRGTTRLEYALFLARALYPEYKLKEYTPHPDVLKQNLRKAVVYNAPDGLNVRQSPNTNLPPIGKLQNGEEISYFATTGNWAIFYYEGKIAYVSLSYLRPVSSGGAGLKGKVIVIDPGHGAHDSGATANGVREKDVNLDIGLRLKKKLEAAGAKVVMTRDRDVFLELSERVAIAHRHQADAFISIHSNAAASSAASGTETYWNSRYASAESKKLAESIQRELIKKLKSRDRGVKEGNFYVIRNTKMASVLIEVGFVTNPDEAKKLADPSYRELAAEAIYEGIKNFYR